MKLVRRQLNTGKAQSQLHQAWLLCDCTGPKFKALKSRRDEKFIANESYLIPSSVRAKILAYAKIWLNKSSSKHVPDSFHEEQYLAAALRQQSVLSHSNTSLLIRSRSLLFHLSSLNRNGFSLRINVSTSSSRDTCRSLAFPA